MMGGVKRVVIVVALVIGCRGREQPGYSPKADEVATAPAVARDAAGGQGGAFGDAAAVPAVGGPAAGGGLPAAAVGDRRAQMVEFVRLGYGDMHGKEVRSLAFQTEALSTDDLKAVVALVPDYNVFEGARVADAVERLRGDISYYRFGREGSPVLYVHLPYWTNQQERSCPGQRCEAGSWGPDTEETRRLTAQEHAALVARVRQVLAQLGADEITSDSDDHELRAWWD